MMATDVISQFDLNSSVSCIAMNLTRPFRNVLEFASQLEFAAGNNFTTMVIN
jgi:hypothetical protein